MTEDEQKELDYLRFFYMEADFGLAHDDVVTIINDAYIDSSLADEIPEGY